MVAVHHAMDAEGAREPGPGAWSVRVVSAPLLAGFTAALGERADLAARTRETYRERVAHYLGWLATHGGHEHALAHPAGRDAAVGDYLRDAVEQREVLAATVNLSLTAIGVFYTWLGLGAPDTPRSLTEPPNPRTLSREQERAVLAAAAARGPRAFAITVLTLDVGPRKSEIAALDLAALDLADWPGTITITDPAGARRTVPITAATRAALVAWLAERRRLLGPQHRHVLALFLTETAPHRRLAHRTVDDIIRAIGHDADLDLSPGALRATAEQHLLHQGHPPATVAARLGQQTPDPQRIRALLGRPAARRAAVPVDGQLDLFGDLAAG